MTVLSEAAPDAAGQGARKASGAELAHHIKSVIGVTATVRVGEPGSVERSQGKARRIIDKRGAD